MDLVHPIAVGNTAAIYRLNDKVVKVFKEGFPENVSVHEAKKQAFAYECGLNVPEIIEVTEINGRQVIIMEYIEGVTIGERLLRDMGQADYFIDICVHVQQTIHQTSIQETSIEWMTDKLSCQIKTSKYLSETMKTLLLRGLTSTEFEPRLCHGDFHPFNVIMNKGRLIIIDWADSSLGDIRADIYRTFLLLSQSSADIAQKYLCTCCLRTGLSQEEIFQWAPFVAGARLSEEIPFEEKKSLRKMLDAFI